ncbi:MAG: helix-turn-helix domain-containing protein [Candidatus Marinimicrobia bacterium]|nr:helix-turn-helix domain-containing protein [Candidatus Neomarinimicrobiota bacterium]MBL7047329.1 helix-turn-helix domain-containing protein [Candidatus Neomarinimicrobiota bacterium]
MKKTNLEIYVQDLAVLEKLDEVKNLIRNDVRDRWLNMTQVCQYTNLSESTIRRAINRGILRVSRKTGKNLFRISWVDSFLEE